MESRAAFYRSLVLITSAALVTAITASCGSGTVATTGDGGVGEDGSSRDSGGLLGDARSDGPPVADAPFACGTTTCRVDQYCLKPCCGGPAPACERQTDAGECPPGFHPGFCSQFGAQSCVMDPCKPAPASCIDDPGTVAGCEQRGSSRDLVCQCA